MGKLTSPWKVCQAGLVRLQWVDSPPPNMLTVGRRCMDEAFSFRWGAGKGLVLIAPSGRSAGCDVEDRAPLSHPGKFALLMAYVLGVARASA